MDNEFYSGIYLGSLLANNNADVNDYIAWLGTDEKESLLSKFNIKRYEKYLEELAELEAGYYWVELDPDEWHVAYWDSETFNTVGKQELGLDEVIKIKTKRIKLEDYETEGND